MDTTDYKIGMLKKLKLYQQQGKKLVSMYREDKPRLDEALREKLGKHMQMLKRSQAGELGIIDIRADQGEGTELRQTRKD